MKRINQAISTNTDFLQALTDFLPALQQIVIAKGDQPSNSSENTNLINVVKEVHETILQIYHLVLQRHTVPSLQVQQQQPVYFQDACGFHTPFHLEFITDWDELITVLKLKFRKRGLRLIDRNRYILHDANSKKVLSPSLPWTLCFFPGQRVNMDALFDEKSDSRTAVLSAGMSSLVHPVRQSTGEFSHFTQNWISVAYSHKALSAGHITEESNSSYIPGSCFVRQPNNTLVIQLP
jgi:hypothetical protein